MSERNRYHVQVLRGAPMGYSFDGDTTPAYHVCDERGRTVAVFQACGYELHSLAELREWRPYGSTRYWASTRAQADRCAAELNEAGARTFQDARGHFAVVL